MIRGGLKSNAPSGKSSSARHFRSGVEFPCDVVDLALREHIKVCTFWQILMQ